MGCSGGTINAAFQYATVSFDTSPIIIAEDFLYSFNSRITTESQRPATIPTNRKAELVGILPIVGFLASI
jgi:hypothetical protein